MAGKKVTFKQRQKKSSIKAKQNINHSIRKQVGGRSRRTNRHDFDASMLSSRTITELITDVNAGSAVAARDNLDARALADLLARPVAAQPQPAATTTTTTTSGGNSGSIKKCLPTTPLPPGEIGALPELPEVPEDEAFFRNAANKQKDESKSGYKKRGAPYAFWENAGLQPPLVAALRELRFSHPTPVQEASVPFAISDGGKKDIVVSAETGSGKTLVFALPVLQNILLTRPEKAAAPVVVAATATRVVGSKAKRRPVAAKKASLQRQKGARGEQGSAAAEALSDDDEVEVDEGGEGEEEEEEEEEEDDDEETELAAVGSSPRAQRPRSTGVMHTLIISPTRELALQIDAAFKQLTRHCSVTVGCVVGGMAPAKQQRVLNRHPDVLVCTPGRIWELVQKNEGCYLGHSISRRLACVVLDEADKLLQSGRFLELKNILDRIHSEYLPAGENEPVVEVNGKLESAAEAGAAAVDETALCAGRWDDEKQRFVPFAPPTTDLHHGASGSVASGGPRLAKDQPRPIPMPPAPPKKHRVVTYVTSATLSLATNYERTDIKKKQIIRTKNASTMRSVLHELGIKARNCEIFDLAPEAGVVAQINESFLRCPEDSKDLYLYYFLRHHGERTVVFVNAISMLRRLVKLLEVLGIAVVGLHASMQQRQRLKFIDKFKSAQKQVLVATDIASRGLDIEGLRNVVHYQVPRSTDAYIHRCGRTARCGGTGLSIMLVNASEYVSYKKLCASLGRKTPMETFAVDPSAVHQLHPHVKLALQIDKLQKEVDKKSAGQRWIKQKGEEIEIDPDDMIDPHVAEENRQKLKAIKVLRRQLEQMVRKDVAVGGRGAYRTAAKQLGVQAAVEKFKVRADRQTNRVSAGAEVEKGRRRSSSSSSSKATQRRSRGGSATAPPKSQ